MFGLRFSKTNSIGHEIRRSFVSSSKALGILQHEWMVEGKVVHDGHPTRHSTIQSTVIFLHGLLGNSKNLRNPAKRLTSEHRHISALLLDLRGHGETARTAASSTSLFHQPHSINACSSDIFETLRHHSLTGPRFSPIAIIGHSLGGRVALQFLHDTLFCQPKEKDVHGDVIITPPRQTWILDSVPGIAHASVSKVLHAVAALNMPIASKKDLVSSLLNMGIDQTIASWMTTNLKDTPRGYDFSFDLTIAQEILHDFSRHDLFQILKESLSDAQHRGSQINLVQAGKNDSWTPSILQRMDDFQQMHPKHFHRTILPKAGHWVHVDDLNGLMTAIHSQFHEFSVSK